MQMPRSVERSNFNVIAAAPSSFVSGQQPIRPIEGGWVAISPNQEAPKIWNLWCVTVLASEVLRNDVHGMVMKGRATWGWSPEANLITNHLPFSLPGAVANS
jgi:hypothetical protein